MVDNVLILDTECTILDMGNPFHPDNKMCVVSLKFIGEPAEVIDVDYSSSHPVGDALRAVRRAVDRASRVVAFNAKFDLHWLRRYGIQVDKPIWCCQLFEFVHEGQTEPYPSLEGCLSKYGLGVKYTDIATEYWNKGINTDLIPWDILETRARLDVEQTEALYLLQQKQLAEHSEAFQRLVKVEMLDLVTLEEMEWNGIPFDRERAIVEEQKAKQELEALNARLAQLFPDVPINWNSTYQRSAALYGGNVSWKEREEVGVYKTGEKAGQPRYRIIHKEVSLGRLAKPDDRQKLATEGYWSTDAAALSTCKPNKRGQELVEILKKRQDLEKLVGTYYSGLQKRINEMKWDDNIIHGQYNQVVAVTGRLSSSGPNMQNQPDLAKLLFITRYQ